jgi:transposase-like protein
MQNGSNCMNETNTPEKNPTAKKRERRYYDAEFKKAAVEHCARHGGDLSGTAAELGVNYWTLRDWVEAARPTDVSPATPRTVAELEAEVRRLKSELARVSEQREILKKSLGILSIP